MAKRSRMVDTSTGEFDGEQKPSRSEQRIERKALQARLEALGYRLTRLSTGDLAKLDLGEELEREVAALATVRVGSARARQRRRVAGLLRAFDLDAFEERVEQAAGATAQDPAANRLERLRKRLMQSDDALSELCDEHPGLDRQRVRQAVRAARAEAETGTMTRRFKALYQLLKELGLGG